MFILLRILLIIVVFPLLVAKNNILSAIFIAGIALLSFFETYSTRKRVYSQLRTLLDVLSDKILLGGTFLIFALQELIPWWAALIFIFRDGITIVFGAVLYYKDKHTEFRPKFWSRIMVFSQIIVILSVLLANPDIILLYIALGLALISGIDALIRSEFKIIKKPLIEKELQFTKLIKISDCITLLNAVAGVISIILSLTGRFGQASILLLIAVIFDVLDGKVARKLGTASEFGKQLDSLADTVSFGVAPAVLIYTLMSSQIEVIPVMALIAFAVFVACGILRLARFNISNSPDYIGMPITFNGILIPLAFVLSLPIQYYMYVLLVLGILMISPLKIKKPRFRPPKPF